MDLLPTFAKIAGGETPQDRIIDGHDVTPLLYGEKGAKSPWDAYFYYFGNELHSVRSGKWKFRAKNLLKNENIYYGLWRDTEIGDSPIPPRSTIFTRRRGDEVGARPATQSDRSHAGPHGRDGARISATPCKESHRPTTAPSAGKR